MSKVRLSVSVSDSHLDRMGDVADAAKRAGMTIEQRLTDLGILTGSIDANKIAHLQHMEGISHVEEEGTVSVPPPYSSIQ